MHGLLNAPAEAPGWYALVCVCLAIVGIGMMVAGLRRRQPGRAGTSRLLVAAAIALAGTYEHLDRLSMTGFVTWIVFVGLAHLFVIAAASASV